MNVSIGHRASTLIDPDIIDKQKLAQFRVKREEWFRLFEDSHLDQLCIQTQLFQGLVDDLTYRVFLQESSIHKEGEGLAIPSLRHLLNVGYVTSQTLLARRLLDKRKDVSSLGRIVKDLKKNRELLTRENFVSYDGTPYNFDFSTLSIDEQSSIETQIWGLEAPGLSNQLRSFNRHERFDKLAKTNSQSRKRDNLIDARILETITRWVETDEATRLKEISDSRFAHASDGSHNVFRQPSENVALFEIENALLDL